MSEAVHTGGLKSGIFDGTSEGLRQIAQVLKSNGANGELIFSFRDMDPEDLDIEEPVFIFFDGLSVPFYIDSFSKKGKSKAVVSLADIRTYEDACELAGKGVFAESALYDDDNEDGLSSLTGWKVLDRSSTIIGTIDSYIDIPGNPCIEVSLSNNLKEKSSCGGTVMIPLHEDLILSVDSQSNEIVMEIPEGLI